ncbi:hypothetical protein L1987_59682 [Smallanthus sonchifolius]|uniref:Uncharacterized protein n=1 Tax=Smallanthus sonchifolius TaxID=185202 RepID=A0ACB9D6B1_9ASTR|nr:hypothetical protein L1987_59682 [Smallanthus sonchifolius]
MMRDLTAYEQKVKGFSYLPEACQRRIIHRDIKAANILLSKDFEPKVKDVMNKQEELPLCKGDVIMEQLVELTFCVYKSHHILNIEIPVLSILLINSKYCMENTDPSRFRLTHDMSFVKANQFWTRIPIFFYIVRCQGLHQIVCGS